MSLHQIAPVLRRLRLIGTSPGIHNTNTNNSNNNNNTNDNNNNNNNNRSASLLFGGGGGGGGEKDNSLIMGSTLSSLLIRACSSVDASNETLVALVLAEYSHYLYQCDYNFVSYSAEEKYTTE